MRLGIITPVVSRNPRFVHHDWELNAGIEEITSIVQAADRLGYHFCTFPEHVAVPLEAARIRGGTYWWLTGSSPGAGRWLGPFSGAGRGGSCLAPRGRRAVVAAGFRGRHAPRTPAGSQRRSRPGPRRAGPPWRGRGHRLGSSLRT